MPYLINFNIKKVTLYGKIRQRFQHSVKFEDALRLKFLKILYFFNYFSHIFRVTFNNHEPLIN